MTALVQVILVTNEAEHEEAIARVRALTSSADADKHTAEIEAQVRIIDAYEKEKFPITPPTAQEAIAFRLEQLGLSPEAFAKKIGTNRRSFEEILNGESDLTIELVRLINEEVGIPADVLIRNVKFIGKPTLLRKQSGHIIAKTVSKKRAAKRV